MDRLQAIKANDRINVITGAIWMRAADKKWLIDTVEQLQEENKRLRRTIRELRRKTGFRVYEENLRLAQEIERLKQEATV